MTFLFLLFASLFCEASSFSLGTTARQESFLSDAGKDIVKLNSGIIKADFEHYVLKKLSVGALANLHVSAEEQSSSSLGFGAFLNWYFYGRPEPYRFVNATTHIFVKRRWSHFMGFGFEERFLKTPELDSELRSGGFVSLGTKYFYGKSTFFVTDLKGFFSGRDYTSVDLSFGLGFYL